MAIILQLVVKRIWRARFDISTLSLSIIPILPMPSAAKYIATGDPSPPAPTIRTLDFKSFLCPIIPIFFKIICLEYLSICFFENIIQFNYLPVEPNPPFPLKVSGKFSTSSNSILWTGNRII